MGVDDRPADRQPHAHAVGLHREEGVEEAVHDFRSEVRTRILDRMSKSPGPLFASMPFMIRFRMTCCNCTRSPMMGSRPPDKAVSSETSCWLSSLRIRTRTSRIASLMSLTLPARGADRPRNAG